LYDNDASILKKQFQNPVHHSTAVWYIVSEKSPFPPPK